MAKKIKVSRFDEVSAPDAKFGKKYLVIVLCLVLLFGGFAIGRKTAPKPSPTINTHKASPVGEVQTDVGPTKKKGIVPTGFKHSTKGAVAAASSYISISTRLYLLTDESFNEAMGVISSAAYRSELTGGFSATRVAAKNVFSADPNAFYREFPMGYVVVSESKDEVTVSVWSQLLLVANPSYNGNTESKVHMITLVWEKGDWKIGSWTNSPGPTPNWQSVNAPLSVDEFITAVRPFSGGYDYAPSF